MDVKRILPTLAGTALDNVATQNLSEVIDLIIKITKGMQRELVVVVIQVGELEIGENGSLVAKAVYIGRKVQMG